MLLSHPYKDGPGMQEMLHFSAAIVFIGGWIPLVASVLGLRAMVHCRRSFIEGTSHTPPRWSPWKGLCIVAFTEKLARWIFLATAALNFVMIFALLAFFWVWAVLCIPVFALHPFYILEVTEERINREDKMLLKLRADGAGHPG
jgi:hypothetical protein